MTYLGEIVINYNDSNEFWTTLDELFNVANYSNEIICSHGLFYYRNCTSNEHNLDLYNRDEQLKQFFNEIVRKKEIMIDNTLNAQDREPIQMTFGPPETGKSRMVDEFASHLIENENKLGVNAICFSVSYNGKSEAIKYDLEEDRQLALSAFCWRLIINLYNKLHGTRENRLKEIFENVINAGKLTLDMAIELISNHPSIKKMNKNNHLCLYFGIDEIMKINQKLRDEFYIGKDGNKYPL